MLIAALAVMIKISEDSPKISQNKMQKMLSTFSSYVHKSSNPQIHKSVADRANHSMAAI